MGQPRCVIARKHSVDLVRGKKNAMYFKPGYIPSMGQMMPHNMTMGKKLPIAIYVAVRSLSHADDTTKPIEKLSTKNYFIHYKQFGFLCIILVR